MARSDLTTPEAMICEVLVARAVAGFSSWTFSRKIWLRPYLDELKGRGLLKWRFDGEADFEVTPLPPLGDFYPEYSTLSEDNPAISMTG